MTAICVVDEQGRRLWRGACVTDPGAISARVLRHAGAVDVKVGVETGSMTPWLVHGLRSACLYVECLDDRCKGGAADAAQQNRRERCGRAGAGAAHGMVSASPRKVFRCASGSSSPWSSRAARGHDDAALQHDTRRGEELRLAAPARSGTQI